jgi:hypothetical protein
MCISLLVQNERLTQCDQASTVLHFYYAWSVAKTTEPVLPTVFRLTSTGS